MTAKKTRRKDPATIHVQNGPRDDLKEGIVQLSRRLDAIVQRKIGRWSERPHGESAIELPAKSLQRKRMEEASEECEVR